MFKHEAVSLFGSVEKLREALGLKTRQAIYMWPDDQPIPEPHEIKIRFMLKPEWFAADGRLLSAPKRKAA